MTALIRRFVLFANCKVKKNIFGSSSVIIIIIKTKNFCSEIRMCCGLDRSSEKVPSPANLRLRQGKDFESVVSTRQ